MGSTGRHSNVSPTSRHNLSSTSHNHPSSHRPESARSLEGHTNERGHDRQRAGHSADYAEGRSQKHREMRGYDSGSSARSSSKIEKKSSKREQHKASKKKHKKQIQEVKLSKKVSKVPQKERGRSKKKVSVSKKKQEVSSSDEEDSSSSYSSTSSRWSSSDSTASSSNSSSQSNSSLSSSSRSSGGSEEDGHKLITIIIRKLPARPSVTSLRDGIFHEFKKCGKVKYVVIRGENNNRYALVLFRNASEASKAISHAKAKLLFGSPIEASLYDGEVSCKELEECGGIVDEFHPRASRTLFVGNLDRTVQHSDIQNIFVRFGEIVAIEIKKQSGIPQYAFLQYTDIASVVKAIQKMDGEKLGQNMLKLGFGKTVKSSCVWVEGITDSFTERYLAGCFQPYGSVKLVVIDRSLGQALIFYPKYEQAQQAINHIRGRKMNGSRLKLDFASHELVEVFLSRMQKSGQRVTTFDSIRHLLLPPPSAPGIPTHNPSAGGSRSGRSGPGHPYMSDPYYSDIHPSRYHGMPHGYESGLPPKGDWRSFDDRNRNRSIYQSISPRGRRYNDERGEFYHREEDVYDRMPRYEQDYRSQEYTRRDHGRDYLPRGYPDDYHRGMKHRDRREPFHHARVLSPPPGRILPRRSRSISPRYPGSNPKVRGREFDVKGEIHMRDRRDHSLPHGRSPMSPASRDGRGSASESWPSRRLREHSGRASPNLYTRRTDERRVELRDIKSQPSSPTTSKGKAAHGSSIPKSNVAWPSAGDRGIEQSKQAVEYAQSWGETEYDRSRSETPTRDENADLIGEVIIKQPPVLPAKQEKAKQASPGQDTAAGKEKYDHPLKDAKATSSTQDSSDDSDSAASPSDANVHSPDVASDKKLSPSLTDVHKHKRKDSLSKHGDRSRKTTSRRDETESDEENVSKKAKLVQLSKLLKREENVHSSSRKCHREKPRSKPSALIKREYSPSQHKSKPEVIHYNERKVSRMSSSEERRAYNDTDQRKSKRYDRYSVASNSEEIDHVSSHKKRRHSQISHSDSDDAASNLHSKGRQSSSSHEHRSKHSGRTNDEDKQEKRARRASFKHEAPMPVASQSFLDDAEEEEDINADTISNDKEPSSQFPPKVIVKEEIVEMMADSDEGGDDALVTEEMTEEVIVQEEEEIEEEEMVEDIVAEKSLDKTKRKTRWETQPEKVASKASAHKVAIAQPFHKAFHPYTAKPILQSPSSLEPLSSDEKGTSMEAKDISSEVKHEKLSQLEKEKAEVQELLSKLDTKQHLMLEEANKIADIFIDVTSGKLKTEMQSKKEKENQPRKEQLEAQKEKHGRGTLTSTAEVVGSEQSIEEEIIQEEVTEVESIVDAPEIIEEQTIEEVTSGEEVFVESTADLSSTTQSIDSGMQEQTMPAALQDTEQKIGNELAITEMQELEESKHHKKHRRKDERSLLRKQKRERERQKRRVERMRGPSQKVISSIVDEEELDSEDEVITTSPFMEQASSENVSTDVKESAESAFTGSYTTAPEVEENAQRDEITQTNNEKEIVTILQLQAGEISKRSDPVCTESLDVATPRSESQSASSSVTTPEIRSNVMLKDHPSPFAVPAAKDTPSSTPRSTRTDPISSSLSQKPSNSAKQDDNVKSVAAKSSPFSPRSITPAELSSQNSDRRNTLQSSSKLKPTYHHTADVDGARRSSDSLMKMESHSDLDQRPHHSKFGEKKHDSKEVGSKPSEQQSSSKYSSLPKVITSLTVSSDINPSEPLGKKELDTLRAELASMRSQLDLDMPPSPGFLSPSSDNNEPNFPPVSPILKSPTLERDPSTLVETTSEKNLVTSPLFSASPSPTVSPAVTASPASSGSVSLTEKMKLLGKVKKKTKSEDISSMKKSVDKTSTFSTPQTEFRGSKFLKSSIFDQDSERLSHLQLQSTIDKQDHVTLSSVRAPSDLIDDKPLFSSFVEKKPVGDSCNQMPDLAPVKTAPKNAFSLSSDTHIPAAAESLKTVKAGKTDESPVCGDDHVQVTQVENPATSYSENKTATVNIAIIGSLKTAGNEDIVSSAEATTPNKFMLAESTTFSDIVIDTVVPVVSDVNPTTSPETSQVDVALELRTDVADIESVETFQDTNSKSNAPVEQDNLNFDEGPIVSVDVTVNRFEEIPTSGKDSETDIEFSSVKETHSYDDTQSGSYTVSSSDLVTSQEIIYEPTDVATTEVILSQEDIFVSEAQTQAEVSIEEVVGEKEENLDDNLTDEVEEMQISHPADEALARKDDGDEESTEGAVTEVLPAEEKVVSLEQTYTNKLEQVVTEVQNGASVSVEVVGNLKDSISDVKEDKPANFPSGNELHSVTPQLLKPAEMEKMAITTDPKAPTDEKIKQTIQAPSSTTKKEVKAPLQLEVTKKNAGSPYKKDAPKTFKKEVPEKVLKKSKHDKVEKVKKLKKEHKNVTETKDQPSKPGTSDKDTTKLGPSQSAKSHSNEKHVEKSIPKRSEKHASKPEKSNPTPFQSSKTKNVGVKYDKSTAKSGGNLPEQSNLLKQTKSDREFVQKSQDKNPTFEIKSPKTVEKLEQSKSLDEASPKHVKLSDKKAKFLTVDEGSKHKTSSQESEKKGLKSLKTSKDHKSTNTKQQKSEEDHKEKYKSGNTGTTVKKSTDLKATKKEKVKKESLSSSKTVEKVNTNKTKHPKPSVEVAQPASKKAKLDDRSLHTKKADAKKLSKTPLYSDLSDDDVLLQKALPREKKQVLKSRPQSQSDAKKQVSKVKKVNIEPKPQPSKQKSPPPLSDSDSSDNFDDFISSLNKGSARKSSFTPKVSTKSKHVYSSSDNSSSNESEHTIHSEGMFKKQKQECKRDEKAPIHVSTKSEHCDSDKSGKTSHKKLKAKSTTDQERIKAKEGDKKVKPLPEKPANTSGKTKKAEMMSDKKGKTKTKETKSPKLTSGDGDAPDVHKKAKASLESKPKHLFGNYSDDDGISADETFTSSKQAAENRLFKSDVSKSAVEAGSPHVKRKEPKSFSSKPVSSPNKKGKSKSLKELVQRVDTFSSGESPDYPPPLHSSAFLTVETIKDETVIPPEYMEQFPVDKHESSSGVSKKASETSQWSQQYAKHETVSRQIYSSSGSDDELENKPFQDITSEEQKKYLGEFSTSTDELSDDSDLFGEPYKAEVSSAQTEKQREKPDKVKHTLKISTQAGPKKQKEVVVPQTEKTLSEKQKHFKTSAKSHEHKKEEKCHGSTDKTKPHASEQKKIKKMKSLTESKPTKERQESSKEKHEAIVCKEKQSEHIKVVKKSKQDKDVENKAKQSKLSQKEREHSDKIKKSSEKVVKTEVPPLHHSSTSTTMKSSSTSKHGEKATFKSHGSEVHKKSRGSQHKEVENSSKHKSQTKQPSQEQIASKHEKEGHHPSKDTLKVPKTIHEHHKSKKDTKAKSPSIHPSKSDKQKLSVPPEKPTKKKSPKPDKQHHMPNPKISTAVLQPIEKKISPDDTMPGKSFFLSDSSDDDEDKNASAPPLPPSNVSLHPTRKLEKFEDVGPTKVEVVKQTSDSSSLSRQRPPPIKLMETTYHKSLFSPTEGDESIQDEKLPPFVKIYEKSPTKYPVKKESVQGDSSKTTETASYHYGSPTKSKKTIEKSKSLTLSEDTNTSGNKSDSEKGDRKVKKHPSREPSPAERKKRLSSFERYQLEQERRREQIKEFEKLSQQRDEEAVRSIMTSSDDSSYVPTEYDYFGNQIQEANVHEIPAVKLETEDDYPQAESLSEPQVDSTTTDALTYEDGLTSGRKNKNPTPEPRSVAEEDELAAALASIEGFDDFTLKKEDIPQQQNLPYQTSSYSNNQPEDEKKQVRHRKGANVPTDEATLAASALLNENVPAPCVKTEMPAKLKPEDTKSIPITPYTKRVEAEDVQDHAGKSATPDSSTPLKPLKEVQPSVDESSVTIDKEPTPPSSVKQKSREIVIEDRMKKPEDVKLEKYVEEESEQPEQEVTSSSSVEETHADLEEDKSGHVTPARCDSTTDSTKNQTEIVLPSVTPFKPSETSLHDNDTKVKPEVAPTTSADRPFVPTPLPSCDLATSTCASLPSPDERCTPVARRTSRETAQSHSLPVDSTHKVQGVSLVHAGSHSAPVTTNPLLSNRPPPVMGDQNTSPSFQYGYHVAPYPAQSYRPTHHSYAVKSETGTFFIPPHSLSSAASFKFPSTIPGITGQNPTFPISPQTLTDPTKPLHNPSLGHASAATNHAIVSQQSFNPDKGIPVFAPKYTHPGLAQVLTPRQGHTVPAAIPNMTRVASTSTPVITTQPSSLEAAAPTTIPSARGAHQFPAVVPEHSFAAQDSLKQAYTKPSYSTVPTPLATAKQTGHAHPAHMGHGASNQSTISPTNKQSSKTLPLSHHPQQARASMVGVPYGMRPSGSGAISPQDVKDHSRPAQAHSGSDVGQNVPQVTPHMFYPPGLAMHPLYSFPGMRPGMPLPQSPYFGMPLPLAAGLSGQQHAASARAMATSLISSRPPYMDIPPQVLGAPTQSPQIAVSERDESQATGRHATGHPKTHDMPQTVHRGPVGGHPYPTDHGTGWAYQAEAKHSAQTESAVDMVDQHFRMSGVGLPHSRPQLGSSTVTKTSHTESGPSQAVYQPRHPELTSRMLHTAPREPPNVQPPLESYQRLPTPTKSEPYYLPPGHQQHPRWPHGAAPQQEAPKPPTHSPQSHQPSYPPREPQQAVQAPERSAAVSDELRNESLNDVIFERYPVIWQGKLALKNESAAVHFHYVCGNMQLGQASLPKSGETSDGMSVVRIVQRMRIKEEQMQPLLERMRRENEWCLLVALPCGENKDDVMRQVQALSKGFIEYLKHKEVAGIVNVEGVIGQERIKTVLHVFPPCQFTSANLTAIAPDLLASAEDIGYLMLVITTL